MYIQFHFAYYPYIHCTNDQYDITNSVDAHYILYIYSANFLYSLNFITHSQQRRTKRDQIFWAKLFSSTACKGTLLQIKFGASVMYGIQNQTGKKSFSALACLKRCFLVFLLYICVMNFKFEYLCKIDLIIKTNLGCKSGNQVGTLIEKDQS